MSGYVYKPPTFRARCRRRLQEARWAVRHWWWVWSGERQRITDERDRYKADAEFRFKQMREAQDAVYMLNAENLPASVDTLRRVADEIDCEPGCEIVGPMDPTTGVSECPRLDDGECPFADACELRDLAKALETHDALAKARGEHVA